MFNTLTKNKLSKKMVFIPLVLLSFFSIVFVLLSMQKNKNSPSVTTPSPKVSEWEQIIPGQSTEADVAKTLGNPKLVDGNTQYYESKNQTKNNQIVYQNGMVDFTKEIVGHSEKRTSDKITSKYGIAQNILYGPDSANGFYLLVYPSSGIAYLGNPNTKDILEVWYFKPTTIGEFTNKWASGYSQQQDSVGY